MPMKAIINNEIPVMLMHYGNFQTVKKGTDRRK